MRPFPQTMPSVRSRVPNAPQRPSWFAQAVVALLLLIGGGWSPHASAAVASVCDLVSNAPTSQSGSGGGTLNYSFGVTCNFGAADVAVTIPFDGTGGASVISPAGGAFPAIGTGASYPFSIQLGPNPGFVSIQIDCTTANCGATKTLFYSANYPAVYNMTLTKAITGNTDPDGSGTITPGDVLTYTVTATNTSNTFLTNVAISDPLITPNSGLCANVPVNGTCVLTGTYTVTAADFRNRFISNVAQATANEFCSAGAVPRGAASTFPGFCQVFTANLRTPVLATPLLSVTKSLVRNTDGDHSNTVTVGDVLLYQIKATNIGQGPVTNVTVSDPLLSPSSVACTSIQPNTSCTLQGSYKVTATDLANGSVVNTGSATASGIPGTLNSNTVTTNVYGSPAMTVSKQLTGNTDPDGNGKVTEGDVLTFTVTATNTGNVPLTNVVVQDPLTTPNSTRCASVAPGGTCVLAGNYTVTATDVTNGAISNTGRATASEFCPEVCTYFSASLRTPVFATNAMTVTKVLSNNADNDGSGSVTLGDVLTFTVTATNTGNTTLNNVQVSDALTTPNSTNCASVAPAATCVLVGTYTVTGNDALNGSIVNIGTAQASQVPAQNVRLTTYVNSNFNLSVTKTLAGNADNDHSNSVTQGDVLTFRVTATNTGNAPLTNVQVSDPLTTPNATTCPNLAPGASCVLNGQYTVTATDASNGSISNTGSATANQFCGEGCFYFRSSLNTPVAPTVPPSPALTVVKKLTNNADNDNSGNVSVGDVLTFTVTATNTGNVTLTNVQVNDPLTTPNSMSCASVPVNGTCVLTGTYTVTAADARKGSIDNTGTATAGQITQLTSSSLNTPVAPLPANSPAMTVVKQLTHNADNDDSGNVSVGDVLTFTVTATNTGNVTLTNVQVNDPLTTPNSMSCASVPVNGTCVLTGTYTVTAADARKGSIDNTGTATAGQITQLTSSSLNTPVAPLPAQNPALGVVKKLASYADNDHSGNVSTGDVLTYTVTATNTGNVALANVHVSDPLTTPGSTTCASVPVNGTCVLTGNYTVAASDAKKGSISNTGSGTASQIDKPVTSSITTPVAAPHPALSVVKQLTNNADNDDSGSVTLGDVLTFTVTATNTGNVTLASVKVTDPLTQPNFKLCALLAPGDSCVLTGTYTVSANDASAGSITNTGSAASSQIDGTVSSTIQTPVSASPQQNFRIVILSGNGQSGAPGQPLAQDFVVAVTPFIDAAVNTHAAVNNHAIVGLSGVPVTWQILGGGGSLSHGNNTFTDADGHSSNHFTLGPGTGQQQVQVCVPIESCVTFTVNSVAPNAALTIVSGSGQSLIPGAASAPLVVHLVNNGSPVANAVIHWSGNNATLASATSTTNSNGDATNTAKVQSPGAATVTASSTSPAAGPVSFSLNAAFVNIPGLTPQQSETANALDHACTALLALESLTPGQADLLRQCEDLAADDNPTEVKNALSELFANIAFLETSAALLIESTQFDNIKARIAALRSGTGHTHFGGLAFQTPDGVLPMGTLADSALGLDDDKSKDKKDEVGSDFDRWGFFASGTFGWGSADPRQVTPGFGFHTNGLTAGVDYRYNDHLIFGMAGGYARYKADARAGMGGLDTSGWTLSAYTTLFKQDSWYMDGVFSWGNNNFDITRRIIYTLTTNTGTTTVDQTATGSSGGSTIAGALTFGRDFTKGPWSFGPYFRGTWTKVSFDDFHEKLNAGNGSGVGLFVQTQDLKSVASVLGGKVNYVMSEDWGVLMPHAEVEWNHEFHDNPDSITARFLNDPTQTPITVRGDPTDTDFFRLGLGVSFVLPKGRSGFIYYEKVLGRTGVTQDNLAVGIRIEF